MHRQKIVSIVVLFVVVSLLAPVSALRTVVLVSDNPADMAIAKAVADTAGGTIVVSPWGAYDEKVLQKILSLKSASVIIIGGSVAVPTNYESALKEKGLKITRIAGKDRFETSNLALDWLVSKGYKLKGNAYILNGWDEGGILFTLHNDPGALIMVVNPHHDLVNAIHEKTGLMKEKIAPATGGYGRSVYVDPTMFGGGIPCNCTPVNLPPIETAKLSIERLQNLSSRISNESVRAEILSKAKLAQSLARQNRPEEMRKTLSEAFSRAYRELARAKPGPAGSSSGSTG